MKLLITLLISASSFAQVLYTIPAKAINNTTYSIVNDTTEAYLIDRTQPLKKYGDEAIERWIVFNEPQDFQGKQIQGTSREVLTPVEASELLDNSILFPYKRPVTNNEWIPNQRVEVGDVRIYKSKEYTCRVAHITLDVYNPENTLVYLWTIEPEGYEWAPGVRYEENDSVTYQSNPYKCFQGHVSQIDWTPPATLGVLWEEYPSGEECPQWKQPQGTVGLYQLGACVTHNGQQWISDYPNNSWEPGVFGWHLKP